MARRGRARNEALLAAGAPTPPPSWVSVYEASLSESISRRPLGVGSLVQADIEARLDANRAAGAPDPTDLTVAAERLQATALVLTLIERNESPGTVALVAHTVANLSARGTRVQEARMQATLDALIAIGQSTPERAPVLEVERGVYREGPGVEEFIYNGAAAFR